MYERFYGLRERPFDLTPDPRFLFLSAQHHEALTHLKYGMSGRPGITLMVGEAGTGKSTLIRAALQGAPADGSRIATLANPTLTRAEFYEQLARVFGFSREAATSKTVFLQELETALDRHESTDAVVALIVDEAQSMPSELLEELRLLTNAEGDGCRGLTLVLVGQPELSKRLNDPSLRQLKQRIALRAELEPFQLKDTAGYIASRITVAGGRADQVFTRDAVLAIHAASNGLPRVISVLCDNALVSGFAMNSKPVGSAVVAEVCADFDLRAAATKGASEPAKVLAAPTPARVATAAEPPRVQPANGSVPEAQEPREMFASQSNRSRFSFFRGAGR